MKRPTFNEPRDLWQQDGSLRDVHLFGTSESDWRAFFEIATRYPHQYSFNGVARPLSGLLTIFANREGSHLLGVTIGNALVNCHFFVSTEIELDIDPRSVVDEATHQGVLQFLELLSLSTGKALRLTAENSEEALYLGYDPASAVWAVHEPQFPPNDA